MSARTDVNIAPPTATPTRKRMLRRVLIVAGVVLGAIVVGLLFYLNSDAFRETVRQRVITELRNMTGGKVELESFTWRLSNLHFDARNVTIHGKEAAGEVPYAHADRIGVDVKILSFFSRKISLENVAIDHLILHLMVYPDGSTNQPSPQPGSPATNATPAQNLFELAVKKISVRQGTLMVDQERIPFDLDGQDISAGMNYLTKEKAYDGHVDVTPMTVTRGNAAPLQAELHLGFLMHTRETEIKMLKVLTRNSKLEASGTLRNYNNPEVTLQYNDRWTWQKSEKSSGRGNSVAAARI